MTPVSLGHNGPLRVGIGGPVGSGKTALTDRLCKAMRDHYNIAAITNDIYTREDASINLAAVDTMTRKFPGLELIFIESGGDNLAATFSPELADITIYVIDVSAGDKIPRKGGPGITRSDLLLINKIDLAPLVGADLGVMDRDARKMRNTRPFLFTNLKDNVGLPAVIDFIVATGGLRPLPADHTVAI